MALIRKLKIGGFSLMEVVVAIFLLTIVWLSAVNVIVISRVSGSMARHKTQAMYLIQQTIENLRHQTFSNILTYSMTLAPEAAGFGVPSIDTSGTPFVSNDDPRLGGVLTVTVAPNTATSATHYKQVVVTITWNESFFGKRKQLKEYCGTYISDDPQAN